MALEELGWRPYVRTWCDTTLPKVITLLTLTSNLVPYESSLVLHPTSTSYLLQPITRIEAASQASI